jgi:hypothetical protein
MEEQKFEFEIDEIPYIVKVIPFKLIWKPAIV